MHVPILVRTGDIGDAVHLVPAILAFRKRFPKPGFTVLTELRNASVFSIYPVVARILSYDRPSDFIVAPRGSNDLVIDADAMADIFGILLCI